MPIKTLEPNKTGRQSRGPGKLRRPARKVLHYILSEFDQPNLPVRLPSIRALAKQLDVSAATVQGVFQRLAEEGRLQVQAGTGSYLVAPPKEVPPVLQVGTNVPIGSKGVPNPWAYKVYGGILHGTIQASRPLAIRPLPPEVLQSEPKAEAFLKNSSELDGFILFSNLVFSRRLRQLCDQTGRPYVDVNPPTEGATANFVSPDYFGGSRRLGEAFRKAGRRCVALVMWPDYDSSVSVRLRCAGLAAGLIQGIGKIALRFYPDENRSGHDVIRRIFDDGGEIPDAIYFSGDTSAIEAVKAIEERGLRVPDDISVVGGNGLGFSADPTRRLTGMHHPLEDLGEEVVRMLLERIEKAGAPVPGKLLPLEFNIGDTTTPEENALLFRND